MAIFEECKLLIWANALLKVAYDFVSDFLHSHPSRAPPPFEIFQFHFVAAGMAIAQKPLDNGPSPTTNRAAYILEELLPGVKTDFVKYMHNANANSELSVDDPDYQLAEFLMFIQHVQYAITGGVAYVSDFQGTVRVSFTIFLWFKFLLSLLGVRTCLTIPQILTSPYVCYYLYLISDIYWIRQLGNDLFVDGNLGEAFDQFPNQHRCNKYCHCQWFKLETPYEIIKEAGSGPFRADTKKYKGKRSIVSTNYYNSTNYSYGLKHLILILSLLVQIV